MYFVTESLTLKLRAATPQTSSPALFHTHSLVGRNLEKQTGTTFEID
jgi:hypothetical protein